MRGEHRRSRAWANAWRVLRALVVWSIAGAAFNVVVTWAIAALLPVGSATVPTTESMIVVSARFGQPWTPPLRCAKLGYEELEGSWGVFASKSTSEYISDDEHLQMQKRLTAEYNSLLKELRNDAPQDDPKRKRLDELLDMMQDWTVLIADLRERRYGWPFRSALVLDSAAVARKLFANDPHGEWITGMLNPLQRFSIGASAQLPLVPIWPGFLANSAIYGFLMFYSFSGWRFVRRWRRIRAGACVACGYELQGLRQCPECGPNSEAAAGLTPRLAGPDAATRETKELSQS